MADRMRVLILHSRYLSGDTSGENRVVRDEARLLAEAGHNVEVWDPSPSHRGPLDLVAMAADAVWSPKAVKHVRQVAKRFRPDVVHCHNLFPNLSPAVLRAATSEGSAVVVTLHNYRMMCLPSTLLRDGSICEDCVGRAPWPGIVHRCYRGSLPGSATLATSITLHRVLGSYDRTSLYLAVSPFVRTKHIEAGIAPERITVKSNFAWPAPRREGPGDHYLFLGRLAPEKGLDTLMEAWPHVPGRLLVVGDGPDAARLRASAPPRVEFTGQVEGSAIPDLIRRARAVLLPSIWYEAQPRVILESFACGVPVFASAIGGLADDVTDHVSGRLLPPGDALPWSEALRWLADDDRSLRLGEGAFDAWANRYTPAHALRGLESSYDRALAIR
jgi:glycosyltransferase involved in cell wall biosynthesis